VCARIIRVNLYNIIWNFYMLQYILQRGHHGISLNKINVCTYIGVKTANTLVKIRFNSWQTAAITILYNMTTRAIICNCLLLLIVYYYYYNHDAEVGWLPMLWKPVQNEIVSIAAGSCIASCGICRNYKLKLMFHYVL